MDRILLLSQFHSLESDVRGNLLKEPHFSVKQPTAVRKRILIFDHEGPLSPTYSPAKDLCLVLFTMMLSMDQDKQ